MSDLADRPALEYFSGGRPGAPFSRAVRVGDILYLSGQIGNNPDGSMLPDLAGQARQTMENIRAVMDDLGLPMDAIFKVTVMLADMDQWREFNTPYLEYFSADRLPARSAFGADKLVEGALVEVECMAYWPVQQAQL